MRPPPQRRYGRRQHRRLNMGSVESLRPPPNPRPADARHRGSHPLGVPNRSPLRGRPVTGPAVDTDLVDAHPAGQRADRLHRQSTNCQRHRVLAQRLGHRVTVGDRGHTPAANLGRHTRGVQRVRAAAGIEESRQVTKPGGPAGDEAVHDGNVLVERPGRAVWELTSRGHRERDSNPIACGHTKRCRPSARTHVR